MEDLLWGGLANIDNSTKVGRGVMGTSGLGPKTQQKVYLLKFTNHFCFPKYGRNSAYDGMLCILAFHISTRQGDNELEEEKYAYAFCPCWWWHNGDYDYAAASFFCK